MNEHLSVAAALDGTLGMNDLRLSAQTLVHQAELAERDGNAQLGQNFRRAAELVTLPDAKIIAVYESLRPSRSTPDELLAVADELAALQAPLCAELVREAARVHARRHVAR